MVTFQSRFGRARWLQPYTDATLRALARDGHARVDVDVPGFRRRLPRNAGRDRASRARNAFLTAGGKEFHPIACLNDAPAWIDALARLAIRHLQGWPTQPPSAAELQRRRERATAAGAPR